MTSERLAAARGAVRDGAAAVDSFAQLLGSRRVGPRGIARALPEVREGCTTLRAALEELTASFAEELASTPESAEAARAVLARASAEVAALEAELARIEEEWGRQGGGRPRAAAERSVDARQRLAVEALVRPASRELGVALYLTDLLSASLELRPTPLSLCDLLRARGAGMAKGQAGVRLVVDCADECTDGVDADPRVVGPLLELSVAVVSRAGAGSPWLRAGRRADGRYEVRVAPASGAAPRGAITVDVPLREGDARAVAVARAAARHAGIGLTLPGEAAPPRAASPAVVLML